MTTIDTIPRITRGGAAERLATAAFDQLLALLDQLSVDEWDAPTDCPGWTVADMVGHLLGSAKSYASVREQVRQQMWGFRHRREFDGNPLDAINALQIEDHRTLAPAERVAALRAAAAPSVRGRMRIPAAFRRISGSVAAGGSTAAGMPSRDTLGHLVDVIITRDVWTHRVDIARATGRDLPLDPETDGAIVADVVAEWAGRHGQPFELTLTGPAGGAFAQGDEGERLELDAVEFCRVLSGRADGDGLLGVRVLF
ncbi:MULTISPECIES: maleylpyruvate isomerase family mycothiol-dependent enzyme [Nocardioides]|uniref:Maleylpyruvate isomerase family mycothiol-dependent enzyme n=1 Tax=Nocardioides vastitatis TaxID=2568655 RepID=A0ABW0ZG97_9ACTN|nr:maleylpyruvate isomerase family mycothiol-dependent enzyme [Nocardioides sp.]THI90835.1 maleylpyruvate isomerase family mycothiol-dependent enzyme [Nocardioides sp.]